MGKEAFPYITQLLFQFQSIYIYSWTRFHCITFNLSLYFFTKIKNNILYFCSSRSPQALCIYTSPPTPTCNRSKARWRLPGYCEFLVFFAANSWRIKANFPLARAENSVIVPLLVTVVASLDSASGRGVAVAVAVAGAGSVNKNSFSILIIWLKLGRRLGSSTQQDLIMKARSGGISSGIEGLSCCISQA